MKFFIYNYNNFSSYIVQMMINNVFGHVYFANIKGNISKLFTNSKKPLHNYVRIATPLFLLITLYSYILSILRISLIIAFLSG